MKQTLYKLEHCNLGGKVVSDVARKTSAANALMSEREREREREREKRKLRSKTQCRERERESILGSKTRRKLQKFCTAKTSTTVDFN